MHCALSIIDLRRAQGYLALTVRAGWLRWGQYPPDSISSKL